MRAQANTLVTLGLLCVGAILPGCVVRPSSQSLGFDDRQDFMAASLNDPYEAAMAAAEIELAERQAAIEFLRELSDRYRLVLRSRTALPQDADPSTDMTRQAVMTPVAAAPARPSAPRMPSDDTGALLRQTFNSANVFDSLVIRCLNTMTANAGKPTYSPKVFDWLCRAAILPEAAASLDGADIDMDERARLGYGVERLLSLAERCRGASGPECGDADKLITQVISQQPVSPVPHYLKKNLVEHTLMPTPARQQSN